MSRRIRDRGVVIGSLPPGPGNRITDVPGVTVGHCTVREGDACTGVTVILPCPENPFAHKLCAASFVWNGFGKTAGLVQVDELGRLESPIALTNTLNVGLVQDALVEYMLRRCQAEGVKITSFNPVVGECNDSGLNHIARRAVGLDQVLAAIDSADTDFALGDVGAGAGTQCHGLKGGIGSASRVLEIEGQKYTLGILVQSNYGKLEDLRLDGAAIGRDIARRLAAPDAPDQGSIMMIVATDLPVNERQLGRIIRRASVGLARLGSYVGHGSGEVMIGFTTACRFDHEGAPAVCSQPVLREELLDGAFRAVAECCEEAVLDSMVCAAPARLPEGEILHSLDEFI